MNDSRNYSLSFLALVLLTLSAGFCPEIDTRDLEECVHFPETPELPISVKSWLASKRMRVAHASWHAGRDISSQSDEATDFLTDNGWISPRQRGTSGSGLDFLAMHRHMIEMVNERVKGNPEYPCVEGWSRIPCDHEDRHWPMPKAFHVPDELKSIMTSHNVKNSKDDDVTIACVACASLVCQNWEWLSSVSLDALGILIENTVHVWMHRHWADSCGLQYMGIPEMMDDPRNDFLGSYYSSHVNKVFWKIHGWIDDRIEQWDDIHEESADDSLTNRWVKPMDDLMKDHTTEKDAGISHVEEVLKITKSLHELWEVGFFLQSTIHADTAWSRLCLQCPE